MKKLKEYAKRFIKEEEGMELVQVVAVLAVTAVLIVAVVGITTKINNYMNSVSSEVDEQFNNVLGLFP